MNNFLYIDPNDYEKSVEELSEEILGLKMELNTVR